MNYFNHYLGKVILSIFVYQSRPQSSLPKLDGLTPKFINDKPVTSFMTAEKASIIMFFPELLTIMKRFQYLLL